MTLNASEIHLSQQALENNLAFIREQIGDNCRFCSVVKGNAYGHGIETFVPMAEAAGVDYFAVYNVQEAERVYNAAQKKPDIMVMGYVPPDALEWAISKGIEFFVFDLERLEQAARIAAKVRRPALVHLELETGMNRTGFERDKLETVADYIKEKADFLSLMGVCMHFAGAESIANYLRIKQQKQRFRQMLRNLQQQGLTPKYRHANCSAAMMRHPEVNYDLVRIGIMQYGFWPSREVFIDYAARHDTETDPLHRVISWTSRVMGTKHISKGEYIGYGTTFLAPCNMRIATVPIGYANGYSRSLSNQGRVLVRGQQAGVVGIVNMNVIVIDITNIARVEQGDEVVLIGRQSGSVISVDSFSELSSQLNYELLTRLPGDIPRFTVN